jgi:hypothetical protein
MASGQDYLRLLRLMLGQGGPNPYMGLGLRDRAREGWDRFAQQYLPQAPGMQSVMFNEPIFGDDEQARYDLMRKVYNFQ